MYIGVDIGGTHTRVASAEIPNKIIQKEDFPTVSFDETFSAIISSIQRLSKGEVQAIGVSCPGPLNKTHGIILNTPNLPDWRNRPLIEPLREKFHCPIYLEHDASSAALAEFLYGAGIGSNPFLYLTISTGIGGGLIKDGEIYEGINNLEIGHQIIEKKGPKCGCGKNGCLEAVASGWAIKKKYGKPPEQINNPVIWDEIAGNLAVGISNSILHYLPELVVLGGGLIQKGNLLLNPLHKYLDQYSIFIPLPPVRTASLGRDSVLIGALALARKNKI